METPEPRIAILMAVYEPRLDWLRAQLLSLNAQTYPNLMLYLRDDASPTVPYEDIRECVQACITRFPCLMARNEKNVGSNLTFQQLTQEAEGDFFAYCDQDDVWLPEKLTVLERAITESGALLVCSDMAVIDTEGKITAKSITRLRRRIRPVSGREAAFRRLLSCNFAAGCTILIRRDTARTALPFLPEMVYDQYLALFAASQGNILALPQQTIHYRIHGGNQTSILAGITSKKQYIAVRIGNFRKRLAHISKRVPASDALSAAKRWADARWAYARRCSLKNAGKLWRCRGENTAVSLFELAALPLPEKLFCAALKLAKKLG